MHGIRITLLAVAFILLLPITLPISIVLSAVDKHRIRSAARRSSCSGCGQVLGAKALQLADAEWAQRMQKMRDQHPHARFRIVRDIHAICPTCGRRFRFVEKDRSFFEVPMNL